MRRNIGTKPGLAAKIIRDLDPRWPSRILDLGCGDGVFLEAVVAHLRRKHPDVGIEVLAAAVTGVEIETSTAARARQRLKAAFGIPQARWDVRTEDALSIPEHDRYDFVVGNPPWIRVHHLEPVRRDRYRDEFESAVGSYDLSYLFVEKTIRLLKPEGVMAVVVPRGIAFQPAAQPLRELLSAAGEWTMEELPPSLFSPNAGIDPGLLTLNKTSSRRLDDANEAVPTTFSDIAVVTSGIATGADSIFVVTDAEAKRHGIEKKFLRPAVRGRDVRQQERPDGCSLVWPYERVEGGFALASLDKAPMLAKYLQANRDALSKRPRLAADLVRHPSRWYRYIDPGRTREASSRFALADIFCEAGYVELSDPAAAVLNTCFEVVPKPGHDGDVRRALDSEAFWKALRGQSRRLAGLYRRTSATELRAVPVDIGTRW